MEHLPNGFTMTLSPGAFPLSTDSMALADFVRLKKNASVLDLGAGCAALGLLLCATDPGCTVTGLELDPAAHEAALNNAAQNGVSHRLSSICGDIRNASQLIRAGSFSCCISNPPYFAAGPESQKTPIARREDLCPLEAVFRAAAWALKFGGDFFLVHRPERLAQLCYFAAANAMEPKTLRLLRHRQDGPVSLVLLHCRKGAKPGLTLEEAALFDTQSNPTDHYRRIYHL